MQLHKFIFKSWRPDEPERVWFGVSDSSVRLFAFAFLFSFVTCCFIIIIIKSCFIEQQQRRGKTRLRSAGGGELWCTSLSKQERSELHGGMWSRGRLQRRAGGGRAQPRRGGGTAALRWIKSASLGCGGWAVRAVSAQNCWSCEPVCVCAHHWKIRKEKEKKELI